MRMLPMLAALLLSCSPLQSEAADHAVILLYHHVGDDTPATTSVTPERFAAHLDELERQGFRVLPLAQVARALERGEALPEQSVAITFDDGFLSVYRNALPLLAKRGWPFAIFVNPDAIDHRFPAYMSWDQLREAKKQGGTILNHSYSHDHLIRMRAGESRQAWLARVEADVEHAQARIEAETGSAPKMLAWPYGEYSQPLQQLLHKMGYVAFAQQSGPAGQGSDMQSLARFPLMGDYSTPARFSERIHTRPLFTGADPEPEVLLTKRQRPLLRLELDSERFDAKRLRCYANGDPMTVDWDARDKGRKRRRFAIGGELPFGRSKYTCTAPQRQGKGYGWYSHLWIVPRH